MRLVTFALKHVPTLQMVGVELPEEKQVCNLSEAVGKFESFSMQAFLRMGDEGRKLARNALESGKFRIPLDAIVRKAPVPSPSKVVCIGLNYVDHCKETKLPIPKEPVVFNKFPSSISADGDTIPLYNTNELDYEVELVIVIGKHARNVKRSEAMDYIAGFTVGHDVSARDYQIKRNGGQWFLGKTMRGYAPTGPAIVTNIDNPHNLGIKCTVNGKVVQNSNTSQLVFKTEELVSHCSKFFDLEAGDLIFTGTPPGVGLSTNTFLNDGDKVTCEIESIGSITNTVVRSTKA
eukprot:CAMPEP_0114513350 /NCGR_PEP_ID=MMETSP0109-20121206/15512_1 /TAXON_ID=29199 /ORGANISM="Chlorarachnion reptans, Strain CCCM449" /LENGTH=290 /DNA_ID=CAMNT_0001693195 /DNA_START=49 /DNA_END=921 /DNA_ORIENTATION=-